MQSDFLPAFIIGFIISAIICVMVGSSSWREACIKHEAAHYDSQTGNFTWNK